MNEKVGKGTIAQDRLFLEAEKLGYDIRGTDDASKKSMSFGFFDGDDDPFATVNSFIPASSSENRAGDVPIKEANRLERGLATESGKSVPTERIIPPATIREQTYQRPDIAQLVESARRFKRDR